jgi:hypothetical protein
MSIIPNIENMTDAEKLAVLESVQKSIAESKEIQKKKIGENVNLVISALKKIESDIQARYDAIGTRLKTVLPLSKMVKTVKMGVMVSMAEMVKLAEMGQKATRVTLV